MAYFVDTPVVSTMIASMIGLGVGIDYALFVVTRHRQHLHEGMSVEDAAGVANATAGQSVLFAGMTVVIAITGLLMAGLPSVTAMGFAAAIVVLFSMFIAVTLLPACLGFAGRAHRPLGDPAPQGSWRRGAPHARRHVGAPRRQAPVALRARQLRRSAAARRTGARPRDGVLRRLQQRPPTRPAQGVRPADGWLRHRDSTARYTIVVDLTDERDPGRARTPRDRGRRRSRHRRGTAGAVNAAGDTAVLTAQPDHVTAGHRDRRHVAAAAQRRAAAGRRRIGRRRDGRWPHGPAVGPVGADHGPVADLHPRRRGAVVPAADGRVPLDPRSAQGGDHEPAVDRRRLRRRSSPCSSGAGPRASSGSTRPCRSTRSCR